MYTFDLCHLGDNCAPGIIMSECLNIRKKTLFMLGFYNFNDILKVFNIMRYTRIQIRNDI
jgi:hypothetical protein